MLTSIRSPLVSNIYRNVTMKFKNVELSRFIAQFESKDLRLQTCNNKSKLFEARPILYLFN